MSSRQADELTVLRMIIDEMEAYPGAFTADEQEQINQIVDSMTGGNQ
jgi:hypothetical protein